MMMMMMMMMMMILILILFNHYWPLLTIFNYCQPCLTIVKTTINHYQPLFLLSYIASPDAPGGGSENTKSAPLRLLVVRLSAGFDWASTWPKKSLRYCNNPSIIEAKPKQGTGADYGYRVDTYQES